MVKDPIMKIKKKSKSQKVLLDDVSGKTIIDISGKVLETEIQSSDNNNVEHVKRGKKKKAKRELAESDQLAKKQKSKDRIEPTVLTQLEPSKITDSLQISEKASDKGKPSVPGVNNKGTKDSVMTRLRSVSTQINTVLSHLHIPKHKNPADNEYEDDDEGT